MRVSRYIYAIVAAATIMGAGAVYGSSFSMNSGIGALNASFKAPELTTYAAYGHRHTGHRRGHNSFWWGFGRPYYRDSWYNSRPYYRDGYWYNGRWYHNKHYRHHRRGSGIDIIFGF